MQRGSRWSYSQLAAELAGLLALSLEDRRLLELEALKQKRSQMFGAAVRNVSPLLLCSLWQHLHMKLNHCWTQSPSLHYLVVFGPPLCPPRASPSSCIYMCQNGSHQPSWWQWCVPPLWAPAALPQQGAAPPLLRRSSSVFSRRTGPEEETWLRPHTAGSCSPPGGLWMLLGTRSPRASLPAHLKFDSSNKQHRHTFTQSAAASSTALHSVWSWKLHGLWSLNYSSAQSSLHTLDSASYQTQSSPHVIMAHMRNTQQVFKVKLNSFQFNSSCVCFLLFYRNLVQSNFKIFTFVFIQVKMYFSY